MPPTPPGWYDDGRGTLRWWDGAAWTGHVDAPGAGEPTRVSTAGTDPAWLEHPDRLPPERQDEPERPARRSRLWIVWVVLGALVVVVIVLAAILVPRLIGLLGGGGGDPDQRAAVAAVQLYDQAWQQADCNAYEVATTPEFRVANSIDSCDVFAQQAAALDAETDDYQVEVTGIERVADDAIVVTTIERYRSLADGGEQFESQFQYTVALVGGEWVIDDLI